MRPPVSSAVRPPVLQPQAPTDTQPGQVRLMVTATPQPSLPIATTTTTTTTTKGVIDLTDDDDNPPKVTVAGLTLGTTPPVTMVPSSNLPPTLTLRPTLPTVATAGQALVNQPVQYLLPVASNPGQAILLQSMPPQGTVRAPVLQNAPAQLGQTLLVAASNPQTLVQTATAMAPALPRTKAPTTALASTVRAAAPPTRAPAAAQTPRPGVPVTSVATVATVRPDAQKLVSNLEHIPL